MTQSLIIKDGNGVNRTLTVESGSYGYIPVHQTPVVTTVSQTAVTSFAWNTSASGTFQIAASNSDRKGLTVFNAGPYNLYISLATVATTTNGFTITDTASAPSLYSFVLFPSGTFIADTTNVSVFYGGYFISGSASSGVFITTTS